MLQNTRKMEQCGVYLTTAGNGQKNSQATPSTCYHKCYVSGYMCVWASVCVDVQRVRECADDGDPKSLAI